MNKKRKKRVKKRKKISKLSISTVAIILATVTVVFCINYIMKKSDFLNIKSIEVKNCSVYTSDYIINKSGLKKVKKIYNVDSKKVEKLLTDEIYIESCKIKYGIPNKVYIEVKERKETYLITHEDKVVVADNNAIALDGNKQNVELFPIESQVNIIYNIGDTIKFEGIDNFKLLNDLLSYSNSCEEADRAQKIYIYSKNTIGVDTKYKVHIKMKLDEYCGYHYEFALGIIKDRLNSSEEVENGTIDFTKGDNPIFSTQTNKDGN